MTIAKVEATPEAADESTESGGCLCDAKLADLTRAIEILADRSEKHSAAVNQLGERIQWVVDTVSKVTEQFKGFNPASMLKGMMSRG